MRQAVNREYQKRPKPAGVFQVKNIVNGKVLLGSSLNLDGALNGHKFLLTIVGGTLFGGLARGIFGFLLAGKEGFVNMMSWGLARGFLGSISSGFAMLISAHYWTGYAERFGRESLKKISEGEDDHKPDD